MPFTLDSIVTASSDNLASDLPDETIILNLPQGTYFGVNGVALDVWRMIQEPITVREIRDRLVETYQVAAEEVERDLFSYLEQLRTHQLLAAPDS